MASIALTSSLTRRAALSVTDFPALSASSVLFATATASSFSPKRALSFRNADFVRRGDCARCFYNPKDDSGGKPQAKEAGSEWAILKRWDVPWEWQTISLTSIACGLSFVLTGLVEQAAIPYLGINITELSLDEKAELLFVDQSITTAVILGVLYSLSKAYPLPDDFFRYDLREPFNLQKGWLLWAGIGLIGALIGIGLTGAAMSMFGGEAPQRETDALVRLLPLIGSSSISTACLVGVTGVLAPLLEETVFRGFFLVAMTKWVPTPVAVLISAAVFALAHLTPGQFPQLFVLGFALGFSYAHTRNLLTSITIHALWNSGVILLLTFLQLQGYDIRELLQAAS
uniref:CAAX prenyl protease 2/Lysostaphin resistance protein A-like domain-containing protein n=1 Tax=Kalanchoe fedtschenkoi TaxID=63787 RepID=A0A7N0ULR5_KALFE